MPLAPRFGRRGWRILFD